MKMFGPTLFLSAFLMFWFEPMVGKMMLPLLGGAASVWITCLLFFQLMLLTGYAYAHVLERYASVRTQILVHGILMFTVLFFLPVHFAARPDQQASTYPVAWLLWQLIKTVGIPFCLVSTTAPLLQNWLSKTHQISSKDPYFLYALSNAGSMIGLVLYPILIEPRSGVHTQTVWWFAGYGTLMLMVFAASIFVWKNASSSPWQLPDGYIPPDIEPTRWVQRLYWLAAAFVPSALMLAVTNHILLNLASAPFLWIIPLATYLTTFMIAFGRKHVFAHKQLSEIVPIVLLLLFPFAVTSRSVDVRYMWFVVAAHIVILFVGALLCHTALAKRRPQPAHLTEFYFWLALGGALGGVFAA